MFAQLTNNQLVMGGGKLQTVTLKVAQFTQRYWKTTPSRLNPRQRLIVVHLLCNSYGLTQQQVAFFLKRSLRTIQRDYQASLLIHNVNDDFKSKTKSLKSYIEYYNNYCRKI